MLQLRCPYGFNLFEWIELIMAPYPFWLTAMPIEYQYSLLALMFLMVAVFVVVIRADDK
jgi:hypothetical protein